MKLSVVKCNRNDLWSVLSIKHQKLFQTTACFDADFESAVRLLHVNFKEIYMSNVRSSKQVTSALNGSGLY